MQNNNKVINSAPNLKILFSYMKLVLMKAYGFGQKGKPLKFKHIATRV